MSTLFIAVRAAVFAGGFLWLWAWLALSLRPWDAQLGHTPEWARLPGAILMAAGAALALSCIVLFVVRGRGTPALFDAPRRFVAVGPYRYTRNPMYVGAIAVLTGLGLYERSPSILLLAGAAALIAQAIVVLVEEPGLRERFGADYEAYLRSVPRWLGR